MIANFTAKTFRVLAFEVRGLQRAAYILALLALSSSLLGLLRDRLFAHLFGTSTPLALYSFAFNIPDIIFVVLGALVSVYILIPELSKREGTEQREYIDTIVVGFSVIAVVSCALAALLAPALLAWALPTLDSNLLPTLIHMTRIMLLQPVLLGFSNILAAITQHRHRYILYALSSPLYQVGIIIGALAFYPLMGVSGLAWGVVLGACFHVGIQLPSIISDGFFHTMPRLHDMRILISTVAISIPRALALLMSQVTYFGLKFLAGYISVSSISVIYYSYGLQGVLVGIIGASYSVAAFPGLAAALARGDRARFIEYVATAARYVLFWSFPAIALIVVLRAHIVRVILGTGAFTWNDTRLVAAAFALFSLSLVAQGLTLLIVRAYYAAGRTFVPFFISCLMTLSTVALGAVAVGAFNIPMIRGISEQILRVVHVPGAQVLALAFSYTFASILGLIILIVHFEHRFPGFFQQVRRGFLQSSAAALAAGAGAYTMLHIVGPITLASTLLTVFTRGTLGGVAGIISAALVYALLRNREYVEIVALLKTRLPLFGGRAPTLAPEVVAAAEEHIVP